HPAHPYTDVLLASIPEPDPDHPVSDRQIEGELPSPINPPSGCRFRTRCEKVQDVCSTEEPVLREIAEDHYVACHFPNEVPVSVNGDGSGDDS
ncbi:MAG: hypothetical protein F4Z02_12595, partial [Acidimicrobiia bacterium]|nr:hypothetical protein [Acidimicrobiia bacterium]MYG71239.1 hypothetical protein [Acidimicrobiia bacterium]